MKKTKFDPRSLLGKNVLDAASEAFMQQTHSFRIIKEEDTVIQLDEEDYDTNDPKCYDVEIKNSIIVFVHVKPYNEWQKA
ncbi:hypothetical protein UFOVP49_95 [uncultured Caudovirales phage]|uniref:Uncharacterized protein n=1 Tax=uncultured Caudovirales phage TaxID=2100421 RepID=A0A6J5KTN2_9CAUD|nr:hypothetical protein UFOVP49_95 [uncultured Caudovirales phage]